MMVDPNQRRPANGEFSNRSKGTLAGLIFLSRWLQAPLYLGLIIAQGVYVVRFMGEL